VRLCLSQPHPQPKRRHLTLRDGNLVLPRPCLAAFCAYFLSYSAASSLLYHPPSPIIIIIILLLDFHSAGLFCSLKYTHACYTYTSRTHRHPWTWVSRLLTTRRGFWGVQPVSAEHKGAAHLQTTPTLQPSQHGGRQRRHQPLRVAHH